MMKKSTSLLLKVSGLVAVFIFITSFAHSEDIIEKYYPSENWMRQTTPAGYIYEYTDENLQGDQWNHRGKLILVHELAGYKTFAWGATQVTVTEYEGDYTPGSGTWSDVIIGERRVSYVYDHKGQYFNLNTQNNGWVIREKNIYATNGTIILEGYSYNTSGVMTRHSIYDASGNLTEEYLYDDLGRLVRNDNVAGNLYYTYTYFGSLQNPRYKYEYTRSTSTLLNTYELITDDFYIKKEADGHIYSYNKVNGTWLTNTQYDPDGTVSFYHYNASLARDGVTKYYTNGNREKLDGNWKLREKIESANSFVKGGNLPWISYGYDLGVPDQWTGFSTSDNKKKLIESLSNFSGGAVRVFLFTDLRSAIDFSGPVLRFYDEAKLYRDMDALLESAAITGTKLIPTLFDYWLAYGTTTGDSGHPDVIKNAVKRGELMTLIGTFINHYRNNSRIAMWDLINEPYYGTNASPWGNGRKDAGGNYILSTISVSEMQAFMNALVATVRINDIGKDVTIGFANKEIMTQYWNSFIDGGADDVDVIQIHYWAKYYNYSFEELDFLATDPMFRGKRVLLGEIDPQYYNQNDPDFTARLNMLFASGYMGGLFWQGDGYTQPITPADMERLQNWYRGTKYLFYLSGRMESKEFPSKDQYGNLYYHHLDEAFDHNGNGTIETDENYGRLDRQIAAQADGDGAIAYEYDYFEDLEVFSVKRCYSDANFVNIVVTYEYYLTSRMHLKTLASGTVYEYSNEDWNGKTYGKLLKETRPDGTYKTFEDYYAATNQAGIVKEYNPMGILQLTSEYYQNGVLKKKTQSNGYVFEYYTTGNLEWAIYPNTVSYKYADENFSGQGYGRLEQEIKADGSKVVYSDYYASSSVFGKKEEFDRFGKLFETTEYFSDGKMKKRVLADGSEYEYYENGQLKRALTPDGFEYSYDDTGRMVSEKYPDGAYFEDMVNLSEKKVSRNIYADSTKTVLLKIEVFTYTIDPKDYSSWTHVETINPVGYTQTKDANGRLIQETVPGTFTIDYIYYDLTPIVKSKTYTNTTTGSTILYEYDALSRLVREVINNDIEAVMLYYGSTDKIYKVIARKISNPNELLFRCEYREDGTLSYKKSYEGDVTEARYDIQGRIKYFKVEGVSETAFGYDPVTGALTKKAVNSISSPGVTATIITQYTQGGRIEKITDLSGIVYEYDASGRLVKEYNAPYSSIYYEYSADAANMNFLKKRFIDDRLKQSTIYIYNASGVLQSSFIVTVPDEERDASSRLIKKTYYDGAYDAYTYFGDATDVRTHTYVDRDGKTTAETYLSAGKLLNVVNWNDLITDYTYDDSGRLIKKADSDGSYEEYAYWAATETVKVKTILDRWGSKTVEEYNEAGLLTKSTRTYGWYSGKYETTYEYDAQSRLIRKNYSYGYHEEYEYWEGTSTVKIRRDVDSQGRASISEFNALGKITKYTSYYGYSMTYTYDISNRLERINYSGNSYIQYEYAGNTDKLLKTTYYYNGTAYYTQEYEYFGDSDKLKSETYRYQNGAYYYKSEYDPLSGKITKTSTSQGYDTYYEYDSLDRVTRIDYAFGYTQVYTYYGNSENIKTAVYIDEEGRRALYEYFNDGRISKITDWDNSVTTYLYDSLNRLVRIDSTDGSYSLYTYDGDSDRMLTYKYYYADGTFYMGEYTYYPDTYRTKSAKYTNRDGKITTYEYGSNWRLDKITYPDGTFSTYQYDASGRITRIDRSTGAYTTYEYYSQWMTKKILNHYEDGTESYDEYEYQAGSYYWMVKTHKRVERDGSTTIYGYDSKYQLVSVTRPDGIVETHTYDSKGRKTRVDCSDLAYDVYSYYGDSWNRARIDHYSNTGAHSYELFTYYNDVFGNTGTETYAFYYEDGTFSKIYYDAFRTILKEQLRDGRTAYYSKYDNLSRVTRKDFSDGTYMIITYTGDSYEASEIITYYASGRMYKKETSNGTVYEYSNEDWNGKNYGKLLKETNKDGSYKTFEDYFSDTDQARYIKEFSSTGELLVTYEYDSEGNFVSKIEKTGSYSITISSELDARLSVDEQLSANSSEVSSLGIKVDGNVVTGSELLDNELIK